MTEQNYGLLPLYRAWSVKRQDSGVAIGNTFDKNYQDATLIGLIYPEQSKPNEELIPLYRAWSVGRQDSGVATSESDFDKNYTKPATLLGWIRPPGKILLEKIDYKLPDAPPEKMSNFIPQTVYVDKGIKRDQASEVSIEWVKTTSRLWRWDNSIEVSMTITADVGIPGIAKGSVEVGAANTYSIGASKENTETKSETYTQYINAAPGETIKANLAVFHTKLSVPYEATFKIVDDHSNVLARWCAKGVYEGVDYSNVDFTYKLVPPEKDKK